MQSTRNFIAIAVACLAALPAVLQAQTYPTRPVKMIVAFAPGGPTDLMARVVANGMAKVLGQQVLVENRAGAGGMIGTREVARAQPDGYTLLFTGDATLTVQPQLAKSAGYEPHKDFTPIRVVASQFNVLIANSSKGIGDVATLVSRAKANPDRISFGSAGTGSPSHLVGTLFEGEAGVRLLHAPYKGAGPAMTDLIGGQIDLMFVGMPVALQNATRKELTILAVAGPQRNSALPTVPTLAEAGIKNIGADSAAWWSVVGPAGVPAAVRAKLDSALQTTLRDADVRKSLDALGVEVLNMDGATASTWLTRDYAKWGQVIRNRNITIE